METLSQDQVAKQLGVDPAQVRGTQDWRPDTHDHLVISELVVGENVIPFRVKNLGTGDIVSKVDDGVGKIDPASVDAIFADTMTVQVKKNATLVPAIMAAIPDLDPETPVVELKVGGEIKIADLVNGAVTNVRDRPVMPDFVVRGSDVSVDVSKMDAAHQAALVTALDGLAVVATSADIAPQPTPVQVAPAPLKG